MNTERPDADEDPSTPTPRSRGMIVRWFRALPLRRKLSMVILATCGSVLLLACAAIAIFEIVNFRRMLVDEGTVIADILGANTQAAVAFRDEAAAGVTLRALAADRHVLAAQVFDAQGDPFAGYGPPHVMPAPLDWDGHLFAGGHLDISRPIALDGKRIGTIAMRLSLDGMYERIGFFGVIVLVVLAGSLLVGLLLSSSLQRPISEPILELAAIAKGIAERKDYTVRAPPGARDEMGALTAAFNHMLAEIHAQNQRLHQQAAELARSNAELEQFTYVSSHDLKEPLRMVTMYMGLLERKHGADLKPEALQFMRYAVEGAARLQQLIDDILSYARLDRPDAPLGPVDLGQAVQDAIANNRAEIERLHARVSVAPLPTVPGERTQLVQLFQNLIGNAIKFHGNRPPVVEIAAARRGPEWMISVRDHGIGIDPAYRQRIFDMFQRLHSRAEYPGTGIGLAICRKIVERHGGAIWVESEPGAGATFFITLRAEADTPPG